MHTFSLCCNFMEYCRKFQVSSWVTRQLWCHGCISRWMRRYRPVSDNEEFYVDQLCDNEYKHNCIVRALPITSSIGSKTERYESTHGEWRSKGFLAEIGCLYSPYTEPPVHKGYTALPNRQWQCNWLIRQQIPPSVGSEGWTTARITRMGRVQNGFLERPRRIDAQ